MAFAAMVPEQLLRSLLAYADARCRCRTHVKHFSLSRSAAFYLEELTLVDVELCVELRCSLTFVVYSLLVPCKQHGLRSTLVD